MEYNSNTNAATAYLNKSLFDIILINFNFDSIHTINVFCQIAFIRFQAFGI